jgi:hypothetical protein
MSDILARLRIARSRAWEEGIELDRVWRIAQVDPGFVKKLKDQEAVMEHAMDELRDALTLDGAAPRPSRADASTDLMKWGVDEGLISAGQYDAWLASPSEPQGGDPYRQ